VRPTQVVGFWAAGLVVLAVVLFGFTLRPRATPLEALLFLGSAALVAAFGLAVLLAVRAGREHAMQQRQPRRATAAVFLAVAGGVAALALVYGWVLLLLALYPLGVAARMLQGERLPPDSRPWPAVLGDVEPAGPARLPYRGEAIGVAVPVPAEHPAHAPPPEPAPTPARGGKAATVAKAGWAVLILVRAVAKLLRRRR
jgi:hypothetical protein